MADTSDTQTASAALWSRHSFEPRSRLPTSGWSLLKARDTEDTCGHNWDRAVVRKVKKLEVDYDTDVSESTSDSSSCSGGRRLGPRRPCGVAIRPEEEVFLWEDSEQKKYNVMKRSHVLMYLQSMQIRAAKMNTAHEFR